MTTVTKRGILAVILIAALSGILFVPAIFEGRVLAPFDIVHQMFLPWRGNITIPEVKNHFVTDAVTQYIPYRMFAEESFRQDGYVGWNPLVFGGTPQFANTMGLYFDWTMQLHRFLSFWDAWHLGLYLQFVIAGVGMFFFLSSWRISAPIALAAALGYMTNWQFIAWVYHRWALGSFCWMPWVLWSMQPWLESSGNIQKKTAPRFAAVSIFLALAFFGGTLQHAAFVVIACFCLFLGQIFDSPKDSCLIFLRFVVWGALAVALAGIMFDPTIRAFFNTNASGHVRGSLGYDSGTWQPLMNVASYPFYLFPFLLGSPPCLDFWKFFHSDMFNVGFFGTTLMLLAVISLFRKGVPTSAKLLITAGLVLPLTPLVGPLYHRVNLLWILGGCWAAAAYVERLSTEDLRSISRRFLWITALIIGLWLFAGAILRATKPHFVDLLIHQIEDQHYQSQFGFFKEWMMLRSDRAAEWFLPSNPVLVWAFAITFFSLWSFSLVRNPKWSLAFPLSVFLQGVLFWGIWTTWSSPLPGYGSPSLVAPLKPNIFSSRITQVGSSMSNTIFPLNTLSVFGVPITAGYDSIHPNGMNSLGFPLGKFPGTDLILASSEIKAPEGWVFFSNFFGGQILSNENAVPIFTAFGDSHLPRSDVSTGTAVYPTKQTYNSISLDVPSKTSEVRFLENWDPGWRYRIDEQGPWLSAEMAPDRSIVLKALSKTGDSRVQIRFFRFSSPWGLIASGLGVFCVLLLLLCSNRKFRIVSA